MVYFFLDMVEIGVKGRQIRRPFVVYCRILPYIGVYWCILAYIGVYWCILRYIAVYCRILSYIVI